MTIESSLSKIIYLGNGQSSVFPVPFAYSRTEDIQLVLTEAQGAETPVTSNFEVQVNASGNTSVRYPLSGAALASGRKLTIYRDTPQTQIVDLAYGGAFSPDVLEHDGFDRLEMQIQEIQEEVDRAIKISISSEEDPPTAEDFYAKVDEIADRAEDAVTRAEDCADRACECAAIAESVAGDLEDLKTLSIAVDDAPYGHMASGSYNADTNMLTLRVPEGKRGDPGPAGDRGEQGPRGDRGETGPTGPTGPQGVQGTQGTRGDIGPRGEKGDAGPQGLPGSRGIQGSQGEQGESGPQGVGGPRGLQGIQGVAGDTGAQGPVGERGPQGPQGVPGAILDIAGGLFGFEQNENGDLLLVYDDGTVPPNMYLDTEGNLIWEGQ